MDKKTDEHKDPNLQKPSGHGWGFNKTFPYMCRKLNHISESFFIMTQNA